MTAPVIFWFRRDLRLADNPALLVAAQAGEVLPIYIFDDDHSAGYSAMGAASRCWLYHSLVSLNKSLQGRLRTFVGDAAMILETLIEALDVKEVFWNRCYEPWQVDRDRALKAGLIERGVSVSSFNGSLLWEPWTVHKKDKTPYKVFTPFYRRGCLSAEPPRTPLPAPAEIKLYEQRLTDLPDKAGLVELTQLALLPSVAWDLPLYQHWKIGEQGAAQRLDAFVSTLHADYDAGRDYPARGATSKLSAHLHFGELSPNQAWHQVIQKGFDPQEDRFCIELGWREFSYSLCFYNEALQWENLQPKFDRFPWQENKTYLKAWQRGLTGYPIVDAGMRELWQTGTMHNRVRMIVGSFLVKNLLLHWTLGERWFWDTLFDADGASNSAGWQWIAGTGADAAPYFRIFNPVTQGKKFDAQGLYTRRYVPELSALPDKYLFEPWAAPPEVLADAGVVLGEHYPHPIVDLKQSRNAALEAYATIKAEKMQ